MVMLCASCPLLAQVSEVVLASNRPGITSQVVNEYSLLEVIKELEKVHDVIFDYRKNLLKDKSLRLAKSDLKTSSIQQVLNNVLPQFGLHYTKYSDRSYLIYLPKEKDGKKSKSINDASQPKTENVPNSESLNSSVSVVASTVSGTVTNELAESLPGASIVLKGTTTGTVTDANGKYTLSIPDAGGTLVISFIGYTTVEETINGRTVIDVALQPDVASLGEVVVVGYGTQKKADLTSSISSVNERDFKDQPVTRLDQVLQGRATGVQVTNSGGAPGGDVRIRVRGANSLSGDNDPLYVIDGFVGGDFNIINPNDIESVEVLKDASATAIYGSRGANGVIIVTTKTGKKGEMKLDLGARFYSSQVVDKWNTLNAGDFAQISNERELAGGGTPTFTQEEIDQYYENGGTDWQDEIFRTAPGMEYQLGISGGSDNVKYLISGNALDQDGVVNNSNFKRYTLRSNITADLSKNLTARFVFTGVRRTNLNTAGTGARSGAVAQALSWAPTTPVRDASGNYIFKDPTSSLFGNPVALTTEQEAIQERTSAMILTGLSYKVIPGLTLDAQIGLNYANRQDKYFDGDISADTDISNASRSSNEDISWQSTNSINYKKSIGIHAFDVTGVFEAQRMASTGFSASVKELTYPSTKYDNLALAAANAVYSGYSEWSLLSLVGRVNYALKDRYLLSASVRRDGSSKFQGDNQYSTFPAVAVGWRISDEPFMQNVKLVSNLKLRASWGLTGAQGINPYGTLSAYSTNIDDAGAIFDGTSPKTITSGIVLANPGNANLKWETTEQIDIGVDFEIAEGRVSLSADYFKKTTDDLHLLRPLPGYAGGASIQSNIGSNENKGFEFAINAIPLQIGAFQWRSTVNLSLLKNKITSLGADRDTIPLGQFKNVLITGQPMSAMWGYKFLGTYKPSDAAEAAQYLRNPGDAHYEDTNGDGAISAADFQVIGTGMPKTSLGFNNTFTYKSLSLNIFFQGLFGFDKQNYTYAYGMVAGTDTKEIIFDDIKGRYIPGANETSDIPKFGGHSTNSETNSSRFVEKGDFLRLKNVSLTYTLPRAKLANVADVRIFISGSNLLTFSNYKGIDPESNSNSVSGLTWDSINTDAQMGLDHGSYPNSKTYTVGFNLTF